MFKLDSNLLDVAYISTKPFENGHIKALFFFRMCSNKGQTF